MLIAPPFPGGQLLEIMRLAMGPHAVHSRFTGANIESLPEDQSQVPLLLPVEPTTTMSATTPAFPSAENVSVPVS